MATIKKYRPGEFCWADLGAKDVAKAKKFYGALFGWKAEDMPIAGGDERYSMFRLNGKDVCAVYSMPDDLRKMKVPPFWLPYISVASADRTLNKVKTAGGAICMGPIDVMRAGRLAIVQDPTGARVAIWQARAHQGTALKAVPGTIGWHDLSTPDQGAAGRFYAHVFGWKIKTMNFSGNPYNLFKLAGKNEGLGGMWPVPLPKCPPAWFTYFTVASCAKAAAKLKRLGGKMVLGPMTVPETCTFAIVKDNQGAAFGILEPLGI